MIWYSVLANEATTVFGYEYVVFYAYATKILVFLQFVEAQEVGTMLVGFPFVDKGRNKVYAWFIGNHKSFFQTASHSQAVCSKLFEVRTGFFIKTYVYLVKVLHIVNVHTHHVAESVWQEHSVCSVANSLFGIAFGKSQFFHSVKDVLAYSEVYIGIFYSWLSKV